MDSWDPFFFKNFKGYAYLSPCWPFLEQPLYHDWPMPEDYNQLAKHVQPLASFYQMTFVQQSLHMCYENEIYQTQKIPMRLKNWHDFFNNLTWLNWPRIKWEIIRKIHAENQHKIDAKRTLRQNLLAHLDECGMIICSDRKDIFQMIQDFEWKKLFWNTPDLKQHCCPMIIGHGLFANARRPYIGLTAKALFLSVPASFFELTISARNHYVDEKISHFIQSEGLPHSPKALHPFPLLGWPQWHPDNEKETFYDNTNYFRPKRKMPL